MPAPYELNRADVRVEVKALIAQRKLEFQDSRYSCGCVIGLLLKERGATDDELIDYDKLSGDVTTLIGKGVVMTDNVEFLSDLQIDHDDCVKNQWGHFSPRALEAQERFKRTYG